ncbi:hypothetical protein BDV25DRAFT_138637 [Aspergillus avenaceus]|uniref:BTB domain-containing protein n=1 Tax=Aspergillus avenaceus TaxID=36643 RepID=A0A5N6TZF3_ASPAV|nr:hypothetical protein BDV25DRAFT_138637 [Aspergillus avenaceus]
MDLARYYHLVTILSDMRDKGSFHDLEVKCQDSVFKVHRAIVCLQSSRFRAMVNNEKETARISIDEDPLLISMMFDYLYKGYYGDFASLFTNNVEETDHSPADWDDLSDSADSDIKTVTDEGSTPARKRGPEFINFNMIRLAKFYGIPRLCAYAQKKLSYALRYSTTESQLMDLVEHVFESNVTIDPSMQTTIFRPVIERLKDLRHSDRFHAALKNLPEFVYRLSCLMMGECVKSSSAHGFDSVEHTPFSDFTVNNPLLGTIGSRHRLTPDYKNMPFPPLGGSSLTAAYDKHDQDYKNMPMTTSGGSALTAPYDKHDQDYKNVPISTVSGRSVIPSWDKYDHCKHGPFVRYDSPP